MCCEKERNTIKMNSYLSDVNGSVLYLLVAAVLAFITLMCVIFLVKSYKTGIEIGMDKQILKKTIVSSATFTLLPSISILLGVIALSGTLGVPFSWLRLSVIGALQYELNVAEIAAQSIGLPGLRLDLLTTEHFVTIALVMTFGILGGVLCCIFFLKKYWGKMQAKPKKMEGEVAESKPGFGAYATTAMFVGLCASYIGSYIGKVFAPNDGDWMPLVVAAIAGLCMAVFEYFTQKKNMKVLDNFSLAASMLIAMAAAVVIQLVM